MQDDIASFLSFQIRRSTESGDTELAMAQLRNYLELEREAKTQTAKTSSEPSNVRRIHNLRAIN